MIIIIGYKKKTKKTISTTLNDSLVGFGLQLTPMYFRGSSIVNTGVDRITQSLYCILSTPRGARLFNPNFGTRLYECLAEPNDFVLRDTVKYYVTEDIKIWEKRIDFDVKVIQENGSNILNIEISFSIKGTEHKYTFVYPVHRKIHELGDDYSLGVKD